MFICSYISRKQRYDIFQLDVNTTPKENESIHGLFEIKKILKVDYPRGRAKGYYTNYISAQKLKIKFSLFTPLSSGNCRMTSPLNFRGEYIKP